MTNDDNGVNVRPLPVLSVDEGGFFSPHTYHVDIRFESAFTQMHVLAEAIKAALNLGKRVVVEHFEMLYPYLGMNAELLIGVGEEILVTRPTIFGRSQDVAISCSARSNTARRRTPEDLRMQMIEYTQRNTARRRAPGYLLSSTKGRRWTSLRSKNTCWTASRRTCRLVHTRRTSSSATACTTARSAQHCLRPARSSISDAD